MAKKIRAWFRAVRIAWNETYEKRLCTIITHSAILWVWCSYILAWFGRYEIAQSLSQEAVRTILGVVIAYSVKSLAENVSKYGYKGKQVQGTDSPTEGEDAMLPASFDGKEPGE